MALIKCSECGKLFSNLAIACPMCGYPVSEEDRIEKFPLQTIKFKDVTLKVISNYKKQTKTLNEMFVSWNKRLSDQTKPISSKDNPFTDNQTSYQIHSIYKRFVDDGRKYSEKFDDFICKLIEKCTTAFKPIFISNHMCFPYDEIQQIVQNLSADYQQRTQKTIDKIKETIAQMNSMPTPTDRPLLISASWTAVVMNEFSMATERAEQNNYNNKITNSECYMCGIWARYQYDSSEIASKYITQLWEAIENSFNEQAVHVLFDDTQPFMESKALQKEWEEFRLNPCNVDNYVFLLSNYQFTQSISDIAATFGIDKNELYFKCCDTLIQKLKSQEIPLLLSKEKMLISNMEVFFEKSETDILKELLKQYSNEVVLSLAEVCEKLPDNIKENLPPKKQAAQVSGRLINSIITADNYLLLSRMFGAEWIEKIKQACHLEGSSESPYEQITKSIFRRICIANDYTAEKATTLSKLEEQKIAFEKELKNKGFFAFAEKRQLKQQLADVEQNIEKAKEDYEMKLEML